MNFVPHHNCVHFLVHRWVSLRAKNFCVPKFGDSHWIERRIVYIEHFSEVYCRVGWQLQNVGFKTAGKSPKSRSYNFFLFFFWCSSFITRKIFPLDFFKEFPNFIKIILCVVKSYVPLTLSSLSSSSCSQFLFLRLHLNFCRTALTFIDITNIIKYSLPTHKLANLFFFEMNFRFLFFFFSSFSSSSDSATFGLIHCLRSYLLILVKVNWR